MSLSADNQPRKLNICIISPNYPPNTVTCGIGDYSAKIASLLAEDGHEITVIASRHYTGNSSNENITVKKIDSGWNFRTLIKIIIHAQQSSCDLVNIQYSPSLFRSSFRIFLFLLNIIKPLVVTFHAVHEGTLISKIEALLLLKFSSGVIVTNDEIKYMIDKLNLNRKNIIQIPIGSHISSLRKSNLNKNELRQELGIPRDILVLSHFGLFYPGKGLETLLDACGHVKSEIGRFQLMLIGARRKEDIEYITKIEKMIDRLKLKANVRFTDHLEDVDVSKYLYSSDIFVVPFDEGLSTRRSSLMAGLVHGLPVITTFPRVPVPYFINGKNIAMVEPFDSMALSDSIIELWRNTRKQADFSEGSLSISRNFDWYDIKTRKVNALYSFIKR